MGSLPAWDPRLAREVALKLLHAPGADSVAGVSDSRGVIEEGRSLARVRHPNVLTVYGAEELDSRVGIWTEFVEGATLASLVKRAGPLSELETIEVGLAVCSALAAVHRAGLHRDVKAQKVMRAVGAVLS